MAWLAMTPGGTGLRDAAGDTRGTTRWLIVALFASIFLQRFAVHAGGGIPLNLLVTLGCLVVLGAKGELTVDPVRAALLLLFLAYGAVCALINPGTSSAMSWGLLAAIYLPFALSLRSGTATLEPCLRAFRTMVLICAAMGILQFLIQPVFRPTVLFTFEGVLPNSVLLQGFNNILPLQYGADLYKSNGFFFLEPSIYCQYVALGIIVELCFFRSSLRLLILSVGLLLSFSGTGLLALLPLLPVILIRQRAYRLAFVILAFVLVAAFTGHAWHMSVFEQRSGEFGGNDSSAHARYIAPAVLLARYLLPRAAEVLFGFGPGAMIDFIHLMPYETHDPTWAKLLFEYGIVGSLLFWAFYAISVFHRAPSALLGMALTIGFLGFGGMLLDPRLQVLILLFCVFPKAGLPASRAHSTPSLRMSEA